VKGSERQFSYAAFVRSFGMRVVVSGSSGLIGSALTKALVCDGHAVSRLVRPGGSISPGDIRWDPAARQLDATVMEGADAIVNFSGASIGEGRWTESRKKILRSSRVDATRVLVDGIAKLRQPPRVFLSASAVGYYGSRGDEILTEASAPGADFLAGLVQEWEAEALRAEARGIRTVVLRFAPVLSRSGGALPRMLTPFRLGVGGRLGSGKQWMSWISLADAVSAILFALNNPKIRGPVNLAAPQPLRNAEFTRILARALHRPAIFPAPAFALRLLLGEMADALLLVSQRAMPEKLSVSGFAFRHADLEAALRSILDETR
jgi:uncharacterized protein (TIGR01777 family)